MPTPSPPPSRPLPRRFARLALINILSNLTVPMASLVDTALLGHLPDIRFLAGVALAAVIFEYVYWSFGFLRMGTTGTTAQALGRGESAEVFHILYRSLALAALLGGAILALQVPLCELGFALLAGSPGVEAAGRAYFDARIWGAPAALANFVLLGWFLGREESGRALAMAAVANLANIVGDWVLIVHYGLAAFGAGIATAASQYLMLAVGLGLFLRLPDRAPWSRAAMLDRRALTGLLSLNRDILVRTVSLITAFAIFTNFSAILGTVTLASNAVLQRLVTLAAYAIDGAAFAVESLAGVLRGAGDRPGLERLVRLSLITGLVFAAAFLVPLLVWPRSILGLLTSHGPTLTSALDFLPWLVPVLVFGSMAYIWDGVFLGLTAGRPLRNAMLLSTLGVFLPLALVAVRLASNTLLWLALSCFMTARVLTLWRASRMLPGLSPEIVGDGG